jgi:hypothetical protein
MFGYRIVWVWSLLFLFIINNEKVFSQEVEKPWEVSGYVKNMQSIIHFPESAFFPEGGAYFDNLIHNRINFSYRFSEKWTFKSDLRNRIFWGDQNRLLKSAFIDEMDKANDFFKLSAGLSSDAGLAAHTMIDRLYVDYSSGNWQFRLGRQRINWGINTFWNPNDIFNAFSFIDFDYEEKPGSDAFTAKYNWGVASGLEFAVKATDSLQNLIGGILYKGNIYNYDYQILTGIMENHLTLGGGWAGNLWDAGFKGEFSWFKSLDPDIEDGFSATVAVDYIFKNGLYSGAGFLYNANGKDDQSLAGIFNFKLSAKNLYPYTTAAFAQVSYSFNPLFTGGLAVIYSPVDSNPVFLSPSLSLSLANELDFALFGQIIFEETDSFKSPVQALFLRLKYSY